MKLTTEQAIQLIDELKSYLQNSVLIFPEPRKMIEFDVIATASKHKFTVNIQRKGINSKKCSYQGRLRPANALLMRLDVGGAPHINPSSGEKIIGAHLHLYTEEYGLAEAIPFDIQNKNLYEIVMC